MNTCVSGKGVIFKALPRKDTLESGDRFQAKSGSLPVFVNKVVLAQTQAGSVGLQTVPGYFRAMTTALGNRDGDPVAHKAQNIYYLVCHRMFASP